MPCHALFRFIGAEPDSGRRTGSDKDDRGSAGTEIRDDTLPFRTSAHRVFAVGDLRAGSVKRVVTAVREGASAVSSLDAMPAGD